MEEARTGFVHEHRLWDAADHAASATALERTRELGLSTIRISFADQHGILRGKTLVAAQLENAFRDGITMTSSLLLKDTSHRTVFSVWADDAGFGAGNLTGARDIIMVPEPASFRVLPWAERTGWMQGEIYRTDGSPISLTGRSVLKQALARLESRGFDLKTGLEVEFHVFRAGAKDGAGALLAQGFQYLTENRYDQLQPILDSVLDSANGLGLPVRTMESEFGPSQCEVTFDARPAMETADNMVRFRAMVKQVCHRMGYHATFMCAPRFDGTMASGWHLHQSLNASASGENAFASDDGLSPVGEHWVAGLLAHAQAGCIFAAPTVNGYRRYKAHGMAPDRVQWSKDNKGAMLRVIDHPRDATRVENRAGEPAANPYLYLMSQAVAGLDGLTRSLPLPAPSATPYDSDAQALPTHLGHAIDALAESAFYRQELGEDFVEYYVHLKRAEWQRYLGTVSEWEHDEYFETF